MARARFARRHSLPLAASALAAASFVASLAGCRVASSGGSVSGDTTPARAASADRAAAVAPASAWRSLIDPSLGAWRGYKEQTLPAGWTVSDGTLSKAGVQADLISREEFGDFELEFEWKLAPGGNAGLFYRTSEEYEKVYWSGPEYQLLDDAGHPDGRNRLTSAAAAYGLYAPPAGVVRPADQWNQSRLVVRGHHVEHWLNSQKVVEYELESPGWKALVKASKFSEWPHYGVAPRGHIALQGDHTGMLSMRNMRIRTLP